MISHDLMHTLEHTPELALTPNSEKGEHKLNTTEILQTSKELSVAILTHFGEEISKRVTIPEGNTSRIELVGFESGVFFNPEKQTFIFTRLATEDSRVSEKLLSRSYTNCAEAAKGNLDEDAAIGIQIFPEIEYDARKSWATEEDAKEDQFTTGKLARDPKDPFKEGEILVPRMRSLIAANLGRGFTGGVTRFTDENKRSIEIVDVNALPEFEAPDESSDADVKKEAARPAHKKVKLGFMDTITEKEIPIKEIDDTTIKVLYTSMLYGDRNTVSDSLYTYGPEAGNTVSGVRVLSVDVNENRSESDETLYDMITAKVLEQEPEVKVGKEMGTTMLYHIAEAKDVISSALKQVDLYGIRPALQHFPSDLLEFRDGVHNKLEPVIIGPELMVFNARMRVETGRADESALVAVKSKGKWVAQTFEYTSPEDLDTSEFIYDEERVTYDNLGIPTEHRSVGEQINEWFKELDVGQLESH